MAEAVDTLRNTVSATDRDLVAAITGVLADSPEPLTSTRIHAALPEQWRLIDGRNLLDVLHRQVAANVLYLYPRYRSPHERFWNRPLRAHLEDLLRRALREGPLSWNDIRRRQPDYAKTQIESVLEELIARGDVFRHPPTAPRLGPRYGLKPADVKLYVRPALDAAFARLAKLGFAQEQMREAALAILHEAEWDSGETTRGSPAAPR